ncbi:MAG: hypothetical protein A3H42_04450 [Deltaproteobacteria bacterium RIFCSPLOWO2_02_FULL_46_8]|nr:MAG: hypothetical protein A3H42_04450 [Deltaproteobacteria bacterium RIFCSPLOWO2_02_FULL_46_8]
MARPNRKITDILEAPFVWRFFRKIIDVFGGIYRKRMMILRGFGLTPQTSVIDIACGTGQYSQLTKADYLGIDMDANYVADAQKRFGNARRKFICADANRASIDDSSYEAAILIDATHHLMDEENRALFITLNKVASKMVVICDPIQQSRSNLIGRFLTSLDRGKYIRPGEALLALIQESMRVEKIEKTKLMGVEGLCILARPKK